MKNLLRDSERLHMHRIISLVVIFIVQKLNIFTRKNIINRNVTLPTTQRTP